MKLLVLIDDYPSENNLYSNMFAHVRVKGYIKNGNEVQIAITSNYNAVSNYSFEGVKVLGSAKINEIKELIKSYKPDAILVHFAIGRIIKTVLLENSKIPTVIWVHGYEALSWKRRLFNFNPLKAKTYYKLASLIFRNTIQLYYFKKLIKHVNQTKNNTFIFVSNWMKEIASEDCSISIKKAVIIGNPIDDSLFKYKEKNEELRFNLLMIRPFNSKKYGTDLVTEAMILLKKTPYFEKINFTIYGKGAGNSRLFDLFNDEKNVSIHSSFVNQQKIKELHDENGVFLAISRQDAQGVSMCEAMSSGLVVISSNNTAIPEYVPNNLAGILTDNTPQDIANKIIQLIEDKALFLKLSSGGSEFIRNKVGYETIISQELHIIKQLITENETTNL